MNTDGKIYIIVTDKMPSGEGKVPAPTSQSSGKSANDNGIVQHWARSQLIGTVKNIASKELMFSYNHIGDFTGDYITQTQVNNNLSNASALMGIGMGALAGFKVGGPLGAVIGASLSLLNSSISSSHEIRLNLLQNKKTNYEIEQLRIRSGLNALLDGSRGTEN